MTIVKISRITVNIPYLSRCQLHGFSSLAIRVRLNATLQVNTLTHRATTKAATALQIHLTSPVLVEHQKRSQLLEMNEQLSASSRSKSDSLKQSKGLNTDGLVGRSWLKYNRENHTMTCSYFQTHHADYRGTWSSVEPCRRIRLQGIVKHEKSEKHRDSVQKESSARSTNLLADLQPPVPR